MSDLIAANIPFITTTDPQHVFGAKAETPDGRIYRYVRAGTPTSSSGHDLSVGIVVRMGDYYSGHKQRPFATAAARGDTEVSISIGAQAVNSQEFSMGYLIIEDDAGEGYTYLIKSHDISSSGSETVNFQITPPIEVATTTSTTCGVIHNRWSQVYTSSTGQNGEIIGVTVIPIAGSNCGWVQTGGMCAVLADSAGTLTQNEIATTGATEGSAFEVRDAVSEVVLGYIPRFGSSPVATEYFPIHLTIDT